jgi:hypothetical protein
LFDGPQEARGHQTPRRRRAGARDHAQLPDLVQHDSEIGMTALATGEWINLSIAIATVVMAAGTFYLAIATQKLARGAGDGIKQAERHHQENLRPFCVLDFAHANNLHPFGVDFDSQASRNSIPICGKLQNKGDGPATVFSSISMCAMVKVRMVPSG